ncbi:MAG TPA: response regulator transcription factor [Pyrinomonadaceae bacterium]|nr:response regulator transcription factor [Pyrinomonadaceae bacterium]
MSRRILIVDDEPNLLTAIAAVLRGEGFEVATARNGKDALLQLAKSLPDLIVSDIRMPIMDGYKLARQLRLAPHTELIPIIFLTAKDETEDRIEGFRSGIDVYLTKPFEPEELIAVIQNIVSRVERTRTAITLLAGDTFRPDERSIPDEDLTDAEWRIADLVAQGLTNKDIGEKLGISIRTVENHIGRILSKKSFSNRVEIARHVLSKRAE